MIKVIKAEYKGNFQVVLLFSNGAEGIFDGRNLLKNHGPLLDALREEAFFKRCFIDAVHCVGQTGSNLPRRSYMKFA